MAVILAIYLFLLHFHCLLNSVHGGTCQNQGDNIICPPPYNHLLEYCCGEADLQQCCSYEDSFEITSTDNGLSVGAIVGIVFACLVVCVILGLLAYFLRRIKMKLDERIMERRSIQRRSMNRGSMNRESPMHGSRGSFKRNSMRTSSRRRDDKEPLNTRESAIFTTTDGLTNPGFDDGYRKPLGRTQPMQNGETVYQNGHTLHSKDGMEIIGLDDSPKMYDKRKQWEDLNDPQVILQLEDSPKMNEKWRHANNHHPNGAEQDATMEATRRYHQLLEQHKQQQSRQLNSQYREQLQQTQNHATIHHGQNGGIQQNGLLVGAQLQQTQNHGTIHHGQNRGIQQNGLSVGAQLQPNGQHAAIQYYQPTQNQLETQIPPEADQQYVQTQQQMTHLQPNGQETQDSQAESAPKGKKKKVPRRNLPKRIRDSEDSKWSMGYTRETVIQLKRNPSSKCNSPTASKDFDPDNPPGILKYRDSEMSDYDSILGDSDQVFDDQSFDRPQSGFFEKLTRRSPSPKQTLAVAPFRHSGVENNQHVPVDQFLTLDPSHLKAHAASYSPSKLSPSQLSPTGREGRYSYFSPNEDFDNSFAKSYPEFVQNMASQPKDVLPHIHIRQNSGGRRTPADMSNGGVNSPKEYIDYNRAGEELRCTSL